MESKSSTVALKKEKAYSIISEFKNRRMSELKKDVEVVNSLVSAFVNDFPKSSITSLSLDDYLIAKEGYGNPNSFCRRIRYELHNVASMGNAFPSCFGIYISNGDSITLNPTLEKMFSDDYSAAFEYFKQAIIALLDAAEDRDYDAIVESPINELFRNKLLNVYYPDFFFPVCTKSALKGYLEHLGLEYNPKEDSLYGMLRLMEWRDSVPEISDWNNAELMSFADELWRRDEYLIGTDLSQSYQQSSFSWDILNINIAIKHTDKSFYEYHETGIPQDMLSFWGIESLKKGQSISFELVYDGIEYKSRLSVTKSGRAKMFWNAELTGILTGYNTPDSYPLAKYERLDKGKYKLTILGEKSEESVITSLSEGFLEELAK